MKPTVQIALFGWPILALALFLVLRPRRAVIASIILGWLFLPMASIKLMPGFPEYSKLTATCAAALLGVLIFDLTRLISFRPEWIDLPMAVWCLCPFASSISNDLGASDGMSAVFYKTQMWGVPYVLGRIYCSNLQGILDLATGIFLGGLLYVPFCLIEIRMSPQLHHWVYGYHQHSFGQTIRFDGWRPMVFMQHGLMVGMWMGMASLTGIWLWISGSVRKLFRVPMSWLLAPLLITTLLCKSLGALVLLAIGLGVLWATRAVPSRAFVLILALLAPLYLALRIPKAWSGSDLTEASLMISPDRSSSLKFRIVNEDMLVDRALQRPVFGWGGWGRARVRDHTGHDISVTDGLWIIVIGNEGFVGLFGMVSVFLAPLWSLIRGFPVPFWRHPAVAPAVALCVMVLVYLVDCIFNNMNNPAYTMAVGGLTCLAIGPLGKPVKTADPAAGVPYAAKSGS